MATLRYTPDLEHVACRPGNDGRATLALIGCVGTRDTLCNLYDLPRDSPFETGLAFGVPGQVQRSRRKDDKQANEDHGPFFTT